MNWAQNQRLRFIESFLLENGKINRSNLIQKFGISVAQASLDMNVYLSKNPLNMEYNKKEKAYLISDSFKPGFYENTHEIETIETNVLLKLKKFFPCKTGVDWVSVAKAAISTKE